MGDFLDQAGLWVCLLEIILIILIETGKSTPFPREAEHPELQKNRKRT